MSLNRIIEWLVSPLTLASSAPASSRTQVAVQMVSHIAAGLAEQDVFIERADVPAGQVIRPDANDAKNSTQPLYASATPVNEDPFKVGSTPVGPFPKGKALGITLGDWLAATGSGTYTVDGDQAELQLTFHNLVPNGSYTLLVPRISYPPKFNVVPAMVGAADGSQAQFQADQAGNADFHLKMPALPESSKETGTALMLVYNSEGAFRGEGGKNLHMLLFYFLPPPAGL